MSKESSDLSPAGAANATYAFVSLGCPKNLVDSERMLGLLQRRGYRLVDHLDGPDLIVINTCGFIEQAREESYDTIREMLDLKRQGRTRGVIVAGCMAERHRDALAKECPGIDGLVGVFGREEIADLADGLMGGSREQQTVFRPAPIRPLPDHDRVRITPRHFAYLKISEGCDRLCTFCSIPKMRGPYASKPIEQVVAEARELADDGVRELIVVAQDTTCYGVDVYGQPRLAALLRQLDHVDGVEWIRLMYLYPMHVTDELIEVISKGRRILPYLDLPLQHINDEVLRRMGRRVTRDQTIELLDRLGGGISELVLRTTLITGFPGETEEQFEELVQFVEHYCFERLGVFSYSVEPDTPAAKLDGHLPEKVKEARRDRLMAAQQEIAFRWNESQVDGTLDVILDAPVPGETNAWTGRSYADAPDVDTVVYVTGEDLSPGQIVPCYITGARDYDLVGFQDGDPY